MASNMTVRLSRAPSPLDLTDYIFLGGSIKVLPDANLESALHRVLDAGAIGKGSVLISYGDSGDSAFSAYGESNAIFKDVAAALGRICTSLVIFLLC